MGMLDDLEAVQATAKVGAAAPPVPKSILDDLEPVAIVGQPRKPEGAIESLQAGVQGSVAGLAWRGKLPELVINPEHSKWWERALSGVGQVAADLPIMIPSGAVGATKGAALGGFAGPGGAAVGGVLGGGAAMFGVVGGIRESLIQAYKSGEVKTAADWWNIVREVAGATAKEAAIGAVTMGAGSIAARTVGKAIAPSIGAGLSVGTARNVIATADVAAQIAGMTTMPAALQGRLPDLQEIGDAAVIIMALKGAHVAADKIGLLKTAESIANTYVKTGKTPAEQVADAQADPTVAEDLIARTGTSSGVPIKLDRLIAEAQFLARGGTPMAPNIRAIIKDIKTSGPLQGDMVRDLDRLEEIATRSETPGTARINPDTGRIEISAPIPAPLDKADAAEVAAITKRLEASPIYTPLPAGEPRSQMFLFRPEKTDQNATTPPPGSATPALEPPARPSTAGKPGEAPYDPLMAPRITELARARLAELDAKAAGQDGKSPTPLTDIERAERVFLANNIDKPEVIARQYEIVEPSTSGRPITAEARDASAKRLHDDLLAQLRAADQQRIADGLAPLGDDHAQAVAAIIRSRVRTRSERMGVLPEELYASRPLRIVDAAAAERTAAEAEVPPDAPRFTPPEVDLFGNPIEETAVPRLAVQGHPVVEAPLAGLALSADVPQFKRGANEKGIVEPLAGQPDRVGMGPIQIWERLTGAREVISGRHRWELFVRHGEETIPAQIHREADGFTARDAAILDAELNIREGQGSVADYAQYFKASGLTKEAADARGLLARSKGKDGFAIARDASPLVLEALSTSRLSPDAALAISVGAPGSERLQALGMEMVVNQDKSILMAVNMMKSIEMMAAERMAGGQHQGDMFGFDENAMREAERLAKKAGARQRAISVQISAVSGAVRNPEIARRMGVDVQDPEGIKNRIIELRQEQYQWENWPLYPELVAKLREGDLGQGPVRAAPPIDELSREALARDEAAIADLEAKVESGEITNEQYLDGLRKITGHEVNDPNILYQDEYSLAPETPAELKARDQEAAAQARRKLAQEAAGTKGPVPTVDQPDLFSTQGTLFEPIEGYNVGNEVRQDKTGPETGGGQTPEGQLDLFAPSPLPGTALQAIEKIVVEAQKVGSRKIGFNRVRSASEAAGVFQDLNKSPRERFQVLGLDANDKPIAFFDLFAGTLTQTPVFPREVWTAVYQTPGVRSVWIAHQHPSGLALPSHADTLITRALRVALTPDVGVTLKGHLIVTKNSTVDIGPEGDEIRQVDTLVGDKKRSLPIMERQIVRQDDPGQILSSPTAVRDFLLAANFSEPGLLVLDAQNRVTGWWPMTVAEMTKLRTGDINTGMAALLRRVGKGNPASAIAYSPKPSGAEFEWAVANVGGALKKADVKMIDAIVKESTGAMTSYAERGITLARDDVFFQSKRSVLDGGIPDPAKVEAEIAALREKAAAGEITHQEFMDEMRRITEHPAELSQQHRGAYDVAENLIKIMAGADKSTVVHELGHSWLEEMKADAATADAPAQIKGDWEMLRRELAIPETGVIPRASHEQFARTVERYLADGQSPSIELRSAFERFRTWLLEIYNDLRNLNVEINPDLREVLDRMLATDQELDDARAMNVPRAYVGEARANTAERIIPPPAPAGRVIEPGFKAEIASMEPYADELPHGPGEAPDNIHVNYAYINSPMDVKLAMERMAQIDQDNIQRQRGGTAGVKSWAEANAEQARYVNDILGGGADTLKLFEPRDPNAAHVDVRLGVLKKLAVGAAKDSARLRDVVLEAGHDATVRQQLEYMGSIERARMIQAEFLGERASVARALNALKDVTEGSGEIGRMLEAIGLGEEATLYQEARTPAQEQAYLKAQLDQIMLRYVGRRSADGRSARIATPLDIALLHKEIGTLKGTFKLAKGVTEATKWEMVVEAWRSGLLSGPVTHTTNLFGTGTFQVMRAPVDLLASVIGMARGASVGMGESDRASMSEATARLTGMLGGIQDGLKVGYHTFLADEATGKTEQYREAIPGRAGELIRVPLRLMGAEDAVISTMYKRGELKTLAIRQAYDENMNPRTREFADRVEYLMDHPTDDMAAEAQTAADRMTFNLPLGEKGVALQRFVGTWNLQWMIPFIRTPINIAKELARMSPFAPIVGEWRAAIAKGGVERDRAIAEVVLGSGIMALTMAYAFDEKISGAGSPDPGKNRGKAGVWQPYSVLIGDTWHEYARIQPMGTLMGMAADMAAIWDHMNDEEKDKLPKMIAVAFSNAVTNQTFLQGITNVINTMSDPGRYGARFFQQFAASLVPNIIGQPTTMADPVVREVNSMLEAIQARIPGLRQDLLPKRDWLGEPVQTKERMGFVMPVREQQVSEDKVRLEAARLDMSMAAAPKKTHLGKGTGKLGDVELTPQERDTFERVGGEMAHRILGNIVNAPGYDAMPDLIKRRIFSKVLSASHRVAAVAALPMDKRTSYLQSISEKVQAELQPGEEVQ